ncbi:MAG: DUF3459 domain-containing protein, partial [Bacteroidetes bacterium]
GQSLNRDECRTPMQWNATANAGFTSGKPWLPVNENFKEKNVQSESEDPNSLMSFYRQLISLRNETPALQTGTLTIDEELSNRKMLAFYRTLKDEKYLIVLNFSGRSQRTDFPDGTILISTVSDISKEGLQPYEARVIRLQ